MSTRIINNLINNIPENTRSKCHVHYSGIYRNYTICGNLLIEYYHINGIKEGEYKYLNTKYIFLNGIEINNESNSNDLDSLEHYFFDYE